MAAIFWFSSEDKPLYDFGVKQGYICCFGCSAAAVWVRKS